MEKETLDSRVGDIQCGNDPPKSYILLSFGEEV